MKRYLILVALFFSVSASAVEDWITLSDTESNRWDGRSGTLIPSKNRNGKDVWVASGRMFDKKDKSFQFEKWYVLNEDCDNGYGKLLTLNMQGDFKYETEFVEKGGTVASTLAALVCSQYFEEKKIRAGKGI